MKTSTNSQNSTKVQKLASMPYVDITQRRETENMSNFYDLKSNAKSNLKLTGKSKKSKKVLKNSENVPRKEGTSRSQKLKNVPIKCADSGYSGSRGILRMPMNANILDLLGGGKDDSFISMGSSTHRYAGRENNKKSRDRDIDMESAEDENFHENENRPGTQPGINRSMYPRSRSVLGQESNSNYVSDTENYGSEVWGVQQNSDSYARSVGEIGRAHV